MVLHLIYCGIIYLAVVSLACQCFPVIHTVQKKGSPSTSSDISTIWEQLAWRKNADFGHQIKCEFQPRFCLSHMGTEVNTTCLSLVSLCTQDNYDEWEGYLSEWDGMRWGTGHSIWSWVRTQPLPTPCPPGHVLLPTSTKLCCAKVRLSDTCVGLNALFSQLCIYHCHCHILFPSQKVTSPASSSPALFSFHLLLFILSEGLPNKDSALHPSPSQPQDVIYWTRKEKEVLPCGSLLGPLQAWYREELREKTCGSWFSQRTGVPESASSCPADYWVHENEWVSPKRVSSILPWTQKFLVVPSVDLGARGWETLNRQSSSRKHRMWSRAPLVPEVAFSSCQSTCGCQRKSEETEVASHVLAGSQGICVLLPPKLSKKGQGLRAARKTSRKVFGWRRGRNGPG